MNAAEIARHAERIRAALEWACEDCITVAGPQAYAEGVQALDDLLVAVSACQSPRGKTARHKAASSSATKAGSHDLAASHTNTPQRTSVR